MELRRITWTLYTEWRLRHDDPISTFSKCWYWEWTAPSFTNKLRGIRPKQKSALSARLWQYCEYTREHFRMQACEEMIPWLQETQHLRRAEQNTTRVTQECCLNVVVLDHVYSWADFTQTSCCENKYLHSMYEHHEIRFYSDTRSTFSTLPWKSSTDPPFLHYLSSSLFPYSLILLCESCSHSSSSY